MLKKYTSGQNTILPRLKPLLIFIFLINLHQLSAQINSQLVTYLPFDSPSLAEESGFLNSIFFDGDTTFVCGAVGDGLSFDGQINFLTLLGDISVNRFKTFNFSVSFYFKPMTGSGTYDIFSKRESCNNNRAFAVTYTPQTRQINALVSESDSNQALLSYRLPPNRCWYHVVIARRAERILLYIDGELVEQASSVSRVNLDNNAQFSISASPCLGSTLVPYRGVIDELRIYDRDIPLADVLLLYTPRDRIITTDTIIFLGQGLDIVTSGTCATAFSWTPPATISNPTIADPFITPTATQTYQLNFIQDGCTAIDTIAVRIIDPNDLNCNNLFLPDAFTPNGDNLNETFGISNPLALDGLDFFEIYDRWGTRVFETVDLMQRWDGSFKGQPLMPGAFMYKLRYTCKGESFEKLGSFTLIR